MGSMRHGDAGDRRRRGGSSTMVGGILLAAATALEYFVLGPGVPAMVFIVFLILFAAAAAGLVGGGVLLASDGWRWSDRGLVGDSPLGHLALYGFGIAWFLSVVAYIAYTYVFRASTINFDLVTASTILLGLAMIAGVVAAISVARAAVVRGFARWSLCGAVALALLSGIVIGSTESLVVTTIAKMLTALGLSVVGLGYHLAKERHPGAERRRS
jgi:hypothetical protein